jgi:adenosylcobinamide-GDP ribazoletransferase
MLSSPDQAAAAPAVGMRVVAEVRAALGLLTILPVGTERVATGGAAAFGFVGAGLGLVAMLPLLVVGEHAPLAAAALALAVLAALSGGLHLDGLADTVDALSAHDGARADSIRVDPHIGAAGAAAVTLTLIVDAAALAQILEARGAVHAALAFLVAVSASRAVPVLVAPFTSTPRPGLGAWFASTVRWPHALIVAVSALVLAAFVASLIAGPVPYVGVAAAATTAIAVAGWLARGRSGLDGDAFGALLEIGMTAGLLAMTIGW